MTPRIDMRRRQPRWGVVAVVLALHLAVVAALVRAFAPDLTAQAVRAATQAVTLTASPSPSNAPDPTPSAQAAAPADRAGASAAAGRKAVPRAQAAPLPVLATHSVEAPPVAATGTAQSAGGAVTGEGTGSAGSGQGTGAGASGTGTGAGQGGSAAPTVKTGGDINSARDYPRATRESRIGASVVIDLAVGVDGAVHGCRVVQPSPDPQADRITCDLATRRFRFRPARDAQGHPVEATYRWRQRWFY